MDDTIYEVGGGYWVKISAHEVPVTEGKPHGIDYSLVLLSPQDERVVGYDNAHPVKKGEGRFTQMAKTNDHVHKRERMMPYQYTNALTLLEDFWNDVEAVLKEKRCAMNTNAKMKTLRIGIASRDEIRARTLAIASGKLKPGKDDPKVWFSSIKSLGEVLSNENRLLLELIRRMSPTSVRELADISGRESSNLSRTLHTMERYHLVHLVQTEAGTIMPIVPYDKVSCDFDLISEMPPEKRAA
jgi:predicted transcriptional regulator